MENSTWNTSADLLRDLKASNADGWAQFVHLYTPLIYSWCRRAGLQEADSADVCQEVFRDVSRGIKKLEYGQPGNTFRGWLWTITRRAIGRHFRKQATAPVAAGGSNSLRLLGEVPDWIDNDQVPEPGRAEAEVMRRAAELIRNDFKEHTWQAFWLSAVESLPARDIAGKLGMSQNAVRQAKFRVMNRLREFVGFDGQD